MTDQVKAQKTDLEEVYVKGNAAFINWEFINCFK